MLEKINMIVPCLEKEKGHFSCNPSHVISRGLLSKKRKIEKYVQKYNNNVYVHDKEERLSMM